MLVESYFGLLEKPFNPVPNAKYFFLSSKHKMALDDLRYGINMDTGILLLIGKPGIGKTSVIRHLRDQLSDQMDMAVIFNAINDSDHLIQLILYDLSIASTSENKKEMIAKLHQHVINNKAQKRRTLIIIDEAQNLSIESLEQIALLSNLRDNTGRRLLQFILAGRHGLLKKLYLPELLQLSKRIDFNFSIEPLSLQETKGYIVHHIRTAGGTPDIFSAEAIQLIHQEAKGVPRAINQLCNDCLCFCTQNKLHAIDKSTVHKAIGSKNTISLQPRSMPKSKISRRIEPQQASGSEHNTVQYLRFMNILNAQVEQIDKLKKQIDALKINNKGFMPTNNTQNNDLNRMLFEERKRSTDLLIKYGRLQQKYYELKKSLTN